MNDQPAERSDQASATDPRIRLLTFTRMVSPLAWLRAIATTYLVAYGEPRQRRCPACDFPVLGRGGPTTTITGKCARCRAPLGPTPWLLEFAVLATGLAVLSRVGPLQVAAYCWFAVLGVLLAVIDLAVWRLPHALTAAWAAGTLAGLLIPAVAQHRLGDWLQALAAGLVSLMFFAVLASVRPGSMGWGDVTAAGVVGIAVGWWGWWPLLHTLVLAYAGFAAYLIVTRRRRGPFGPFLIASALVIIVASASSG
ncbi:prepilin peptidase [Actinoplanes cyaneus]|uniref:Prepilin peptidase n=1 Tax=Actinoplanes cyaneus TaxID=52696 RepID=A0A919M9P6_9ACTN|nr:A24 family peptidase [Actinoplanes cyaneus]MCW2144321.1 leader peptidase (prepilin peptidase) / N-methyltransferase [Actinoplanes cyaneus]GID71077.1 prepilin peptidase [Actinoplanes cyaneus]